ncbi:MFS transporter [Amycolatopsis sp. GM8]|uniref:MFS transporter n=1 Tax=Amycolatopsis sp. GM8 TaxID=2896530 RepID=UPI001F2812B3|nr:MFS transporter [Amycolatopsis sp. GM8]
MSKRRSDRPISAWAPFAYGAFRVLFVTQLVANVGRLMQAAGSAWSIQEHGGSAVEVSLVQTATYTPLVVLGFAAGTLADRVDRRLLLVACQAWMALSATALFVVSLAGGSQPNVVLALTFAIGLGTALAAPTWTAIQPALVPPHLVGRAMALNGLTFNVAQALGPALAGLVIAAVGTGWVFAINATTLSCTVVTLLVWRSPVTAPRPTDSFITSFRSGIRCITTAPQRQILLRYAVFFIPAASVTALMPVLAAHRLHLTGTGFGVLMAMFGAGAALSVVIWPAVERRGEEWGMVLSTVLLTAALIVSALVTQPVVVAAALLVAGIAYTLGATAAVVAAQRVVGESMRARVMAAYVVTSGTVVAAASALWGLVAKLGVAKALGIAAVLAALSFLARRRLPLPDRDEPAVASALD